MDAGDVLVILQQTEHLDFVRQGLDLIIKKKITLADALCGFSMTITHLDARKLLVMNPPGHVVFPGKTFRCLRCVSLSIVVLRTDSTRGIRGEGMPAYRRPHIKGNLYIKFEIEFPENGFLPHDKLEVRVLT